MGRQINFFMGANDEKRFWDFVVQEEKAVVLAVPSKENQPRIAEDFSLLNSGEVGLTVYLWNPRLTKKVFITHVKEQDYYLIDETMSDVIQWMRCTFDGVALRRGRLWVQDSYWEDGRRTHKNPKLLQWFERLRRWLKAYCVELPEFPGWYIGREALSWYQQGGKLAQM